jgi:phosphoribosyl-AMP cyclohydrolase
VSHHLKVLGEAGLIAAVAQDAASGRVLTVAWMNRAALKETVERGEAVYWSRSRRKLSRRRAESSVVPSYNLTATNAPVL